MEAALTASGRISAPATQCCCTWLAFHRLGDEPTNAKLTKPKYRIDTFRERRAKFWQARSQPVELVESEELEKIVGSPYYPVALLDRRGGLVNPFACAQGLAKAALAAGCKLSENSPAKSLVRHDKGWRLTAGKGAIDADTIVLATDAYTDDLWHGLAGRHAKRFATTGCSQT
jgi:glycine/D-amino acid oxidase-like deaminating enzyme